MSIAGTITKVEPSSEGVYISLEGEDRGQNGLLIINPPTTADKMQALIGTFVWGGSSEIMIGNEKWAERIGYTRIKLCEVKK